MSMASREASTLCLSQTDRHPAYRTATHPRMPSPPSPHWTVEIGMRLRWQFPLKVAGTTFFTWIFFIGYFHVLRHPLNEVTLMPLTLLDRLIPFQPETLIAYLSLWIYVGVGPGLQLSFRELFVYALWIGALCLTGLALFYLWPTQVPPLGSHVSDFPGFALLHGVDAPQNACPSLHVATAMFTAIRAEDVLRRARTPRLLRVANWLWFLAIAYSTMAIKQHVALDVAAGALLGIVFALPSLRWRPNPLRVVRASLRARKWVGATR
jgi:membrane-associated phospholipid phosphatase